MYLKYWDLEKNPFDNVPDPHMYFQSHSTVEATVAELLFAIEEGNECLAAVVGEVGLGKTMALRVVLDSLDPDQYRVAFVTNPDITFVQLLREIIGQLQDRSCTIRDKEGLLEEFNRILFKTADEGKKVLIFVDEGNAMRPSSLEGLRLLTNMQEDTRNLLTLILAGQPRLGRMLEHPKRANLFQRIGVYSRLHPLDSPELVRDYVEHRLERAGAPEPIFTDEAYRAIYEHSRGVPRLINRVCKLALKAGETNQLDVIDGTVVRGIADRFRRVYFTPETEEESPQEDSREETAFSERRSEKMEQRTRESSPGQPEASSSTSESPPEDPESSRDRDRRKDEESETVPPSKPDAAEQTSFPASAEKHEFPTAVPTPTAVARAQNENTEESGEDRSARPRPLSPEQTPAAHEERAEKEARSLPEDGARQQEKTASSSSRPAQRELMIPAEVIATLRELRDDRKKIRLAGQLAAKQIQEHPERYREATSDPVKAWDELRNRILQAAS